jgi:DNA-binding LytR/AlgR family response regulator
MHKYNFIIVEDEPLAREIIRTYSERIDNINITGEYSNANDSIAAISSLECDFAVIDINMPKISGIELIKSIKNPPEFIITTANREFAVEAFEINAVDYLVKPFSFDRYLSAVNKIIQKLSYKFAKIQIPDKDFIMVKSDNMFIKIEISEIYYIEAYREYVKIHTRNSTILSLVSMKNILDMLPKDKFFRIHRSFIISIKHLDFVRGFEVIINNKTLPISRELKDEFILMLQQT